jgi:carbon storage regulator CsrA
MIVFRRKKRDQIVINGNIVVTVMHIRGSRVSLGIEAPEGVRIRRSELTPHQGAALMPLLDANDAPVASTQIVS